MLYHPIKILLVEDNPGDVLLLQETLAEMAFVELQWVHVERLSQALTRLQAEAFDVILLDLVLPDSKGLDTFVQLQTQSPHTPIVVLTGMTDETLAMRSMQAGAQDYLIKGQVSGSDLLLRSIRYAIERKRIEATLQKRERELRTLTENAPDIIVRLDGELRHLYVNAAVARMTGLSARAFLGKTSRELGMPTAQVDQWEAVLRQVFRTGEPRTLEFEFPTPQGIRYYQARCVPEFGLDGAIESVLGMTRDITEQKQAVASLRESEARFAESFAYAAIGMAQRSLAGRFLQVNPALCEITGYSEAELLALDFQTLTHPDDLALDLNYRQQLLAGEIRYYHLEKRYFHKSGRIVWILLSVALVRDEQGQPLYFIAQIQDVSDRKRAEQKVQEQAALIDISPDAILVRDLECRVLFWNKGAAQMYGWPAAAVLGRDAREFLFKPPAPQLDRVRQTVLAVGEWQGELTKVTQTGQDILVSSHWKLLRDAAGAPEAMLTIDRDITAQKQLEAQFLRAQRLESLGTLASGIAHDLNNVLTPILAIAQLLPLKLPDLNEQNRSLLKVLEDSARRGADMVKQILTFTRGLEGDLAPLAIAPLLMELEAIVRSTFPKSIDISCDRGPRDLWPVSANATHLHQVFINFCVNARDAMPQGGTLRIAAANRLLDETDVRLNLEAKVGPYVVITFSDTGMGIPPEHQDRIFEPFFTTKPLGEGTGLGLSTAVGIIRKHGGFVTVTSKVGVGTQFQVFLPAVAVNETVPAENSVLAAAKGELILVVDDEVNIRETLKLTLESYSYRVMMASHGVEAIATYRAHQAEIKAVLLDIMMPVMGGTTVIQTLQQLNPQVRIIACSGVAVSGSFSHAAVVKAFLPKPFTAYELLQTVQTVLRAP